MGHSSNLVLGAVSSGGKYKSASSNYKLRKVSRKTIYNKIKKALITLEPFKSDSLGAARLILDFDKIRVLEPFFSRR